MTPDALADLLERVSAGAVSVAEAMERLRGLPFERLASLATIDHHRELRTGVPEVVYGEHKSGELIAELLAAMAEASGRALATRVSEDKARIVCARLTEASYDAAARTVAIGAAPQPGGRGVVAVVAAGSSDTPVAREASVTLEFLGHRVDYIADVGIAGLHRLIDVADRLRTAQVAVVVAGMEGALPSAVAGLIDRPIIAVPTSIGYGVGLGGFVALLSMLSSCAPGVSVVNIDNGFGAAVVAAKINAGTS